jgi:hypothetical protein
MAATKVKYKNTAKKSTVQEELEHWNVILILRRLNKWFHNHFTPTDKKKLRGLEANDFSIGVLEKIIRGDRSWQNSNKASFIDFCYDVAGSELCNWRENAAKREFVSYDIAWEKQKGENIEDNYNGF